MNGFLKGIITFVLSVLTSIGIYHGTVQTNKNVQLQNQPAIVSPIPTATQTFQVSPTSAINLSVEKCISEIKSIIPQADKSYLDWYSQWQEARKTIDSCYNSNPVPVCDKQLSALNIEWQNKLTDTMNNYKQGLPDCTSQNIKFSNYSKVIDSAY